MLCSPTMVYCPPYHLKTQGLVFSVLISVLTLLAWSKHWNEHKNFEHIIICAMYAPLHTIINVKFPAPRILLAYYSGPPLAH